MGLDVYAITDKENITATKIKIKYIKNNSANGIGSQSFGM